MSPSNAKPNAFRPAEHLRRPSDFRRVYDRRRSAADLDPAEVSAIEQLVAARTAARKEKDWARADQIRAQLDELGVDLTDTPEGPVWQLR